MKTIITASIIVLSALSLNANEIRSTSDARNTSESTASQSVEATVEQLNSNASAQLESEARTCIAQNTEATMKYLADLESTHRAPNQIAFAQHHPVRFLKLSR